MAMSINRLTKEISYPKADLTLISGTLYELDTDAFRLEMKGVEAGEEGMAFTDMHTRNAPVTVAGIEYAQTLEMINGYSLEFEDGAYSVRLIGSNNNLFDIEAGILVQNQVQVIPTNSAGLIDINKEDIEYAAYNEGVTLDEMNGGSGTTHPWGTSRQPVDNTTDLKSIATARGLYILYAVGDATIAGNDFDGFDIKGRLSEITFSGVINARIYDCKLLGTIGKSCWARESLIGALTVSTVGWGAFHAWKTAFLGPIVLDNIFCVLQDCVAAKSGDETVTIDLNDSTSTIHAHKWSGNMLIKNGTVAGKHHDIHMLGGHLTIDSSTTEGTFHLMGSGIYTNNGGSNVTVHIDGLMNTDEVWLNSKALTVAKFLGLK